MQVHNPTVKYKTVGLVYRTGTGVWCLQLYICYRLVVVVVVVVGGGGGGGGVLLLQDLLPFFGNNLSTSRYSAGLRTVQSGF